MLQYQIILDFKRKKGDTDSSAFGETSIELRDQGCGASGRHGVPVYSLCWYQITLLGNRNNACEQLARVRTRQCRGWD